MRTEMPGTTEPFADRVKRLAAGRSLSVSKLGYLAYDPDVKGTNPDTFKSVMAGRRSVNTALIEAVSSVLQIPPEEFPEYRLAVARRQLDEREVGLEQALETLSEIEDLL